MCNAMGNVSHGTKHFATRSQAWLSCHVWVNPYHHAVGLRSEVVLYYSREAWQRLSGKTAYELSTWTREPESTRRSTN